MKLKRQSFGVILTLVMMVTFYTPSLQALEIFAKGSYSKNYISEDKYTTSISTTVGFGFSVFPGVTLEARYTRIGAEQNKNEISGVGTLSDLSTRTSIYSAGLDIELLGRRSVFQPFVFIGAGYVVTERDFFFTDLLGNRTTFVEPDNFGVSGNAGLGFRIRMAKGFAFEVEAYAYSTTLLEETKLFNVYGTAGIRFYF